jgi:putative tryptophan/tyrosine transport system substrate-binding protein
MTRLIDRREFVTLFGGVAMTPAIPWPRAARAERHDRLRRVGVLMAMTGEDPEARRRIAAFEQGLRELRWHEGRNILIDYRWAADDPDRLRREAAALIAASPDVILANSTPVLAALRKESTTLPMVFVQVTDPVGNGFVPQLARPGGNVTGFTNFEFGIGGKWLQTLKEVAPALTQVAVVFNPQTAPFADAFMQPIEVAGRTFGVAATATPAGDAPAFEAAVNAFARAPNGGLIVLPDVSTVHHRELIIALAARHRLPAIYPYRFYAVSGGLISYGTDVPDVFRRAAAYVDRVLKGEKPGDLPVQAPARFETVVNLKTAKALGLESSPMLLARADELLE